MAHIIGTPGDDDLSGTSGDDLIEGLGGNDTLFGGYGGNDTIYGGDGNDWLTGGNSSPTSEEDFLFGGAGNDFLELASFMAGGTGNDRYNVWLDGNQVTVSEAPGQGIDEVESYLSYTLGANIENLTLESDEGAHPCNGTGNELANVITGNNGVNVLSGLAGNDRLYGDFGNDTLYGGDGNDILDGGLGADRMLGGTGTGNDTFYVDNTGDQVVEYTNQGTDSVFASISYTLTANVENLTLTGTAALNGIGNGSANVITGNGGKNVLSGLAGNDTLTGGANADVLIGGTGPDRFDFNLVSDSTATARDAIRAGGGAIAFEGAGVAGGDVIDLSGIDANTTLAGNQAFVFGGTGIGRISFVNSGTTTLVRGNVDADATFEFVLAIEDGGVLASAYKAGDFIL